MGVVGRGWGEVVDISLAGQRNRSTASLACHSRCQWASKPIADTHIPRLVWGCSEEKRTPDTIAAREGGLSQDAHLGCF